MGDFPNLEAVLAGDVPALIVDKWQDVAADHRASGEYAAAMSFVTVAPYNGEPLAVAVINTAKHARILEEGRDGFHLPSVIDWSGPKVRVSKDGTRYLRIPFRHRTPGTVGVSSEGRRTMMPQEVMAAMRGKRSRRAARLIAASSTMSKVYDERLYPNASERTKGVLRDLRRRVQQTSDGSPLPGNFGYTWVSPKHAGMRRVETGTGSGVYQTIRTMTEHSAGFFIPPMPGFHFAQRTIEAVRPHVVELVAEAARADFVELIDAEIQRILQ